MYKASAGSGKTFTLATEYIKLLVENPQNYRGILAVTFTNKATEEMKRRILSQLYGIWRRLDDSESYTQNVCQQLDATPEFVSQRAGVALHLLLHNYNHFQVETIDAFFQRVLRNLARELDLTPTLRIELKSDQVEEFAVDSLVEGLDKKSEELRWIMRYVYDNIADDKSWNVITQIKEFGQTIFKDYYRAVGDQLTAKLEDSKFLEGFITRLKSDRKKAKDAMTAYADRFFEALDKDGLRVEDLAYGKGGAASFFMKLKNGDFTEDCVGKRVVAASENSEAWTSKKSKRRDDIMALAEQSLMPLLNQAIAERPRQNRTYKSAEQTLKHLYELRLLGSIERKIREMNEDANRFMLSDTQHILHSLIGESDSPFIFEKIGTRLEHIMIDEFQDTGTLQWANFKILLLECMSRSGAENLIVGDVKQSIYRWRAGDWRLLNDIAVQFHHPEQQLDVRNLGVNYRSKRRIVEFNNAFFKVAAQLESEALGDNDGDEAQQLLKAYDDVSQDVPKTRGEEGYVNICLLPSADHELATLERIGDIVEELLGKGVEAQRIAILIRTNKHIPVIAKFMAKRLPKVKLVSDEAFRLDASLAVNAIVLAIRLLYGEGDPIAKATLAKIYQNFILKRDLSDNELLAGCDDLDRLLPPDFTANRRELVQLPLYDMAERLYSIFRVGDIEGQSAYVCAFFDKLGKLTEENFAGIDVFLEEWDSHICSDTIQCDEIDGIRLLSIHKSKGLEFDSVIIPFCDWKLEQKGQLWCKPDEEPYNELPLVPVEFSEKALKETIYEKDYRQEHFQNVVDNLNLLYVAFTRACDNLYVIGADRGNSYRSALIKNTIPLMADGLRNTMVTEAVDKDSPTTFEFGELFVGGKKTGGKTTDNVFLKPTGGIDFVFDAFDTKAEFRQSNKSRDFIDGEEDGDRQKYISTGNVLHKVFSTIRTKDDIPAALKEMELEGVLYEDGQSREELVAMLAKRLNDSHVAEWFSDRWTLFNECTILTTDNATGKVVERRPDRVMTDGSQTIVVDFKFGRPRDEYKTQVREYMSLLSAMGHNNISGYLWFVYSNKIEKA